MGQTTTPEAFSARLRCLRLAAGLTQAALAERAGVAERTIQQLERGTARPQKDTLQRLIDALSPSPDDRASLESVPPTPRRRDPERIRVGDRARASRTIEVPNNLPVDRARIIGRDHEMAEIGTMLRRQDVPLVTLTGTGGVGKTRLALHVAAGQLEHFADGVFLVELAPISDPELVPSAIAQVLDIRDLGGRPIREVLSDYVRDRSLLLILDNFEQIVAASSTVSALLAAGRHLKLLVTSREPLRVRGEHEYEVVPLKVPDLGNAFRSDLAGGSPAVMLFVDCATAIRADFALTDENASAIYEICVRLDGLPLAIELAAAQIRLFSPRAMLARFEHRLPLLTGGARDAPTRQQTMRGAIAWSYDLLDASERALFRRLAIFVGGCTLEAAGSVCDPDGDLDVLNGIAALIAKSLLRQTDGPNGEPRFWMLELIREYAQEQLKASGEAELTRRAHASYFLALAEDAESKVLGAEQIASLRWVAAEYENLQAVLGRCRSGQIADDVGLRLAGTLGNFWALRGRVRAGRAWTEAMLDLPGAATRPAARARLLHTAATMAFRQADYVAARSYAEESVSIFREAGDLQGAGRALIRLGVTELSAGNIKLASRLYEKGAMLARKVGDRHGYAYALSQLASVAFHARDSASAGALLSESVTIARELGDRNLLGVALCGLALLARMQRRLEWAKELFNEALIVSNELQDHWIMLRSLAGLAGTSSLLADCERAARLFGAVAAVREANGTPEMPVWRDMYDRDLAAVQETLGESWFAAVWAEGRAMSLEQAIAYALEEPASTR